MAHGTTLTKPVWWFKERPGAKALLKILALFVRLKPHAPSEKAKMGFFIRQTGQA
jgi:hypothetical protein